MRSCENSQYLKAELTNLRMGCSEQLITCGLWQLCSAALSLPEGQGFKLRVCFCSFISLPALCCLQGVGRWCLCFMTLRTAVMVCAGCPQPSFGVLSIAWPGVHLHLWAQWWELLSCTELILSPWAQRIGQHGTAHFIWQFKCCWPKEILWQILLFCCALNQKAGRLFRYISDILFSSGLPVAHCEGKALEMSPCAFDFL